MKKQDYSNHARLVGGFHGFTFLGLVALLIGSIVNVVKSSHENLYSASLLVLTSILLILLAFYARSFALKAQDRAIRAEENMRHFILTQKILPKELTIRQIIGLRFASDEEYLALIQRAIKENLSEKEIKKAIKNWKGDYYRV
ncbi:DUF6526 family protein [Namhaeicola litoreus]|uniref:DUF6526 family protein n=1 Tax=Namhaeicola litoreus TaxID=1052145 RepID=A0ABW3XZV2_9FLAO